MKKIATYSLLSTAIMASTAMAHTTIQSTITATNGATSTSYNNIVIGHACSDASGKHFPIRAQSVLFPTVNPEIYVDSSPSSLTIGDLTNKTTLAGLPQLIQSKDIFTKQSEKTIGDNVVGFNSYKGELNPDLHGLVPFRFGAITFKTGITGLINGCVNKLLIKVAIADICKTDFAKGGPKAGQAELWIPNLTNKFTVATDDSTTTTPHSGSAATLTIDNSSACNTGSTVTVWPSDADVDANLVIPKVWGK